MKTITIGAAVMADLAELKRTLADSPLSERGQAALLAALLPIAGASGAGPYLSEDCKVTLLETSDIGGTNASTPWVSMVGFDRVFGYVEIGTWNATDDLDECRLEQATASDGTGAKDLTTDASGGNYDTDNPVDADGDFVILEARAEDFDVEGGFNHVRLYVAEGGNTGVDNVTGFLIRYGSQIKKAELNGAAVTGSKVYVRPS